MRKTEFVCHQCKKTFVSKKADRNRIPRFCSQKCYGLSIAKIKKCLQCGQDFYNYQNKYFCSMECSGNHKAGVKFSQSHRKALSEARKGKFCFERHAQWKGDDVGYGALHEWVYRKLGSPMICEFCGREKKDNRNIHWSNKSGKYKRSPEDWERLCVSCHKRKDLSKIRNVNE